MIMMPSVLSSSSLFFSPFPARKKTTTTMLAMLSPDGDDRPRRLLRGTPESLQSPPGYLWPATRPVDRKVALEDYVSELKFLEIDSQRVYEAAVETPLQLSQVYTDNNFWIKREDLQPKVGAFNIRGAYLMMSNLSREELDRGVITVSTGNHAVAVAFAANILDCKAELILPLETPAYRLSKTENIGGRRCVIHIGNSYEEAESWAKERAQDKGLTFVPAFDHRLVIAGQGTVGMEIMRQLESQPDAIFVPVGGGGLIAGVAAYIKTNFPEVKVIGVEPFDSNKMALSLLHGQMVELEYVGHYASALAIKRVGEEGFALSSELVDGMVLVDKNNIEQAILDMYQENGALIEPAGALALAGAVKYCNYYGLKGQNIVAICSGSNLDPEKVEQLGAPLTEDMLRFQMIQERFR